MARKRTSPIEDLMEIGVLLPWQASVLLAVVAYFGFHYLATLPVLPFAVSDPKQFGSSIGGAATRQLLITIGMYLQYIVPLALLVGAAIALIKKRRSAQLHAEVARAPSREALERLSWREFEQLAAEVFRRKGFQIVQRGGEGPDGGVDIELHLGKDKYFVQCKQWKSSKVGVATVRELYGVMAAEGAVGGFVVASGEFTEEAKRFAEGRAIELVPAENILRMVEATKALHTNAAHSANAQQKCPNCGSAMVLRTAKRGDHSGAAFMGCSRYPSCRGIRPVLK